MKDNQLCSNVWKSGLFFKTEKKTNLFFKILFENLPQDLENMCTNEKQLDSGQNYESKSHVWLGMFSLG